ncbi:hypothetical protein BDB00DRAFT_927608 [Zychaea mexicana]|uniref:uncharacterized protein n=1 Tax=Zychaea mexicana TaxID=64656 RepID=UPI0022FED0C6|nr:uncharacterized protein BDB00DRAFT_927608 [Zychaea mexicana]KAI9495145.1 hypothetical protein BDB00DRAFT_927608 [Zychaea mexicana]
MISTVSRLALVLSLLLLLLGSLSTTRTTMVSALPVFDADLAANPFVHDARMSYYERRKATVLDTRAMMMEDDTFALLIYFMSNNKQPYLLVNIMLNCYPCFTCNNADRKKPRTENRG